MSREWREEEKKEKERRCVERGSSNSPSQLVVSPARQGRRCVTPLFQSAVGQRRRPKDIGRS
ncbi:hypothetical protein IscW_ISCW011964 [Ixodes scapularis]|uniref:Uncharacterized protein n=1 Tax=Ixodes scapularis TaxID=6945 RepID=B7QDU3_IXOSC|nr:hypothetical protein IscW_ISCW011964 [Ixodes scapularis]|eukprot:XP_002413707.1 hypothetical protein IscW_ISCW011964 [Ixodes scapularis]